MTREELEMFIESIMTMRNRATDAMSWDAAYFFPAWRTEHEYTTGDRVRHGSTLYRCLQAHTSQSDWTPDTAVSLWVRIDDPAIEWPAWRQPQGAVDAYPAGAKVSHPTSDRHWISDLDNNVWEPGTYGWSEA